jgi:hypothetical protein
MQQALKAFEILYEMMRCGGVAMAARWREGIWNFTEASLVIGLAITFTVLYALELN